MKKTILISSVIFLVAAACSKSPTVTYKAPDPVRDYKNASYLINGQSVNLINGAAEIQTDSSSTEKTIIRYFGNEAKGDFNGDGTEDIAFLLTSDSGGSGTFYYLVAGLNSAGPTNGTNAILIGDRISPQTTEFTDGNIIVNYADRNPGEPMTTAPSLGVSRYFRVQSGQLMEIPKP